MPIDSYINRDRSALAEGVLFGRKRRRLASWKIGAWLFAMACVGVVIWQFNKIQPQVIAMVGYAPTATPFAVTYAQHGDLAFWRGDLATSIDNYRHAVASDPTNVDFRYELIKVLIYHSYEDRRNGRDVTNTRLDANGKQTLPVYAQIYDVNNPPQVQGALEIGEQAVLDNPTSSRAWSILCFARMSANKDDDAVRACLRALDLNANDPDTYAFEAYALYDLGRYDTALDTAQKAVTLANQINQKSIDALIVYASTLEYKGKFVQAQDALVQATLINPRLEFPYFSLAAWALINSNPRRDPQVAIDAYTRVLTNNPHSVKAYTRLCQAYFNNGEFTNASDNCDAALQIDPTYLDAIAMKGQVQYRGRNYEDAVNTLDDCIALETKQYEQDVNFQRDEECWVYLGLAKFTLGRCDAVDGQDQQNPKGAIVIMTEYLDWGHTPSLIAAANDGIDRCNKAYAGKYVKPTPKPTPTELPTPILPQGG